MAVEAVRVQIPPTALEPWLGSQGFLSCQGCFSDIIALCKSLAARHASDCEDEQGKTDRPDQRAAGRKEILYGASWSAAI